MENVNRKRLMENAIQYVKGVYEEHGQLVDFHPNFIKDLGMLDPAASDAPTKLKKIIDDASPLDQVLDPTSLPLMKIWDYCGQGLMVLKGDKCFEIVCDLQPMTSEVVLKVYKIHDQMFLCIHGIQKEADYFFQAASKLDSDHLSNHQKHMSPDKMSFELSDICFKKFSVHIGCNQVIAGFSDDNEACIYTIDTAAYRQKMSDFAVIGSRESDLYKQCMDLRENKLDHKKLSGKALRATAAALAVRFFRFAFRAHMYSVTPDMVEERRIEGKGALPVYYLRS